MMTTTAAVPTFRTQSRVSSTLRALWIVFLCAALTAGFLAQTWHAPRAAAELDARGTTATQPARAS